MVPKIYVNKDLKANITCPKCNKVDFMDVSRFIGHHKEVRLKYTCKCKHKFTVLLERRRYVRKDKELNGHLIVQSQRVPVIIMDISKYGFKVKLFSKKIPEINEVLTIEFTLDDPSHSKVVTQAKVRRLLSPNTVGCEFLSTDHYDNLGKYFLFNF